MKRKMTTREIFMGRLSKKLPYDIKVKIYKEILNIRKEKNIKKKEEKKNSGEYMYLCSNHNNFYYHKDMFNKKLFQKEHSYMNKIYKNKN